MRQKGKYRRRLLADSLLSIYADPFEARIYFGHMPTIFESSIIIIFLKSASTRDEDTSVDVTTMALHRTIPEEKSV